MNVSTISKCCYLSHCPACSTDYLCKPALRLYPVVPGIRRSAIKDTCLPTGGGERGDLPIFIPVGTDVIASQWAMHSRNDLFGPDADEFIPERWASLDPGWAYFPFGGGQRTCLGRKRIVINLIFSQMLILRVRAFCAERGHVRASENGADL